MKGAYKAALACALATLLAGCASDKPKPTALEAITPKIAGRQVWQAQIGAVGFPLAVAVRNEQFTVASSDGTVAAFEAATGREIWRGQAGGTLTAGVGADGRHAAVVVQGNQLVVLEAGREKWRKQLTALVTTAPLVAGERVFVVGVDRAVQAFDAADGRRLWSLQRPGDALTLSQSGVLAAWRNTLLVGHGARLVGVEPNEGKVVWEVSVGNPRGTNEVERLADLVGPAVRQGNTVCARSFQVAVGCVNVERGTLNWTRNNAGARGLGGDAEFLFGADASDRITAWKAGTGEVAWTKEKLLHRALSGPVSAGRTVVFGDVEGQLHFLDRNTGEAMLRLPTDGSAVAASPVLAGTTMLVVTRRGGLFAFRPE